MPREPVRQGAHGLNSRTRWVDHAEEDLFGTDTDTAWRCREADEWNDRPVLGAGGDADDTGQQGLTHALMRGMRASGND
jgi:hypothetical protein